MVGFAIQASRLHYFHRKAARCSGVCGIDCFMMLVPVTNRLLGYSCK